MLSEQNNHTDYEAFPETVPSRIPGKTSRFTAGVLQIFAGVLGLGRFYMKSYKTAVCQLVFSLCTLGIGGFVWGFFDGFAILSGKILLDGNGRVMDI